MTHDERVHELLYSNDGREEMCERICKLEELCKNAYTFAFNCYHGVFDQEVFFRLREKYHELCVEV